MKQSRIRRLASKKALRQFAYQDRGGEAVLAEFLKREGATTIGKMRDKGYELLTCLQSGEGVFVREEKVVGLHIQLPAELYQRLSDQCQREEVTKRSIVLVALESYLSR